ncbi:MAG: tRNA uridine-5-carboxymethylaminomethyl(34) synthesis GTPase MnmE [Deltaproteobacteria bacterium]|nr:tRNA uridine-5-carboxymethylaminomethyl(34) synthesis GTPase MnmE [Deltaproteobacteria bacterium]
MPSDQDTIAAIATPMGQAGIGIIRISGPGCLPIVRKIFRPRNAVPDFKSHRLYLGHFCDPSSGDPIDEVLLTYMKAPRTYTREDVVEINSHSGYILLSKILDTLLAEGARLAGPGEFTLRAFLNGRIDLTQAEAVVDLIQSRSERGLFLASQQIRGALGEEIEALRQKAVHILARAEAAIDFPEAEADAVLREEGPEEIETGLMAPIESLISASEGRIWVEGVRTVIAGRVNAGKSSLLNRLLNEQRAIVTPIPGTTRDVIEGSLNIEGIPLLLMDTAGFRSVGDEVERLGITLTRRKLKEADLVLIVIDQSRPLGQDDLNIIHEARGKQALIVINKIDLPVRLHGGTDAEALSLFPSVRVSALTGEGLDHLRTSIKGAILGSGTDAISSHAGPNARHRHALAQALGYFKAAALRIREDVPMEIVALELKSGLDALGEITGETTTEEVLDSIFSQFCLGK